MLELDLLAHVDIEVACPVCAEPYEIPASTVLESQRLIAAGCPGDAIHECPPRYYATLLSSQALAALAAASECVEASALTPGGAPATDVKEGGVAELRTHASSRLSTRHREPKHHSRLF